jgi:hypothetical protein
VAERAELYGVEPLVHASLEKSSSSDEIRPAWLGS